MQPEELLSIALRCNLNKRLWAIAVSVAIIEGWFDYTPVDRPNIPQILNNPGNLRPADSEKGGMIPPGRFERKQLAGRFKRSPSDPGYVEFLSVGNGWGALVNDLTAKAIRNLTLETAINIYAPSADGNNPDKYARLVGEWCEIPINTVINRWTGTLPKIRGPFPDEVCPRIRSARPLVKEYVRMISK